MEKEEFIEKAKQLAFDYWTMGLQNGTYESEFRELLEQYENKLLSCNQCGSLDIRKD
jgi:rubrerythrin